MTSNALPALDPYRMEPSPCELTAESKLLGPLTVMDSQVYRFRNGLYGFPDARSHALLPLEREGFFWLQSIAFPALTFLLVDPFRFVDGYSVDLTDTQLAEVSADDPATILVLSILTLPSQPGGQATVNLQGPIALNVKRRLAMQTAVDSVFGIRHPLDL